MAKRLLSKLITFWQRISLTVVAVLVTALPAFALPMYASGSSLLGLLLRPLPALDGKPGRLQLVGWISEEAQQSQLCHGDVLLAVAGTPVSQESDIQAALKGYQPSQRVLLRVLRGKEELEVALTLADGRLPMMPAAPSDQPAATRTLQVIPASPELAVQQYFGWGHVRSMALQDRTLLVRIDPVASTKFLQRTAQALFAEVRSPRIQRLTVLVEGTEAIQSLRVDVKGDVHLSAYTPDWQTAPTQIAAETFLPILLDLNADIELPQSETRAVSGKLLSNIEDQNGVPLLLRATPVQGRLVPAIPFGHRLILDTIGEQKWPVVAQSEILPTREVIVKYLGNQRRAYTSRVFAHQVVGVRLSQPLALPNPLRKSANEDGLRLTDATFTPVTKSAAIRTAKALSLYNQAVAAIGRQEWSVAATHLRASLADLPSQQAHAALGWVYLQMGQALLKGGGALEVAMADIEQAAQMQVSGSSGLLSCAYALAIQKDSDSLPGDNLNYYRYRITSLGIHLQDCPLKPGVLPFRNPPVVAGDYLAFMDEQRPARMRYRAITPFSRSPVRLYIGPAPEPRFYQAVLDAARSWQDATDKRVQFVEVNQPTEADVLVVFVLQDGNQGPTRSETLAMPDQAATILLNLAYPLRYRTADQARLAGKVLSHELGHALGLWGHSDSDDDIMYPTVSGVSGPSLRDVETLKKVFDRYPAAERP
ncbi:matrixin family metalloprotease [Gloeobacter kilaueensis]|uniref:Zn-dependent protease n=1 Tax=Gloeobacter kilaueensis (strain ATCC BAA-2537 / CCAP 1431/1 / ULC 316 / JS1) TaxID=1183438 RepID=U5QJC2_GLOK1|nr:matrixin family metalloprotease [Gloeobacter kilaueensis]AGY57770.1 Zn-dependent protease [Gloeobacter kilaueensis JS1]